MNKPIEIPMAKHILHLGPPWTQAKIKVCVHCQKDGMKYSVRKLSDFLDHLQYNHPLTFAGLGVPRA